MRALAWLPPALSLVAAPAYALAIRPPPLECGDVSEHGRCDGAVVLWCDVSVTPNVLVSTDCAAELGAGALCVDPPGSVHPTCVAPLGAPCLRLDPAGVLQSIPCLGTMPGCVQDQIASACTDMMFTCTANDIGRCVADRLVLGCTQDQPWVLDCPAFGGHCGQGLCVDAALGAVCGPNVRCAAPLVCGRLSRCEEPPDAGVPADDASVEDAAASPDAVVAADARALDDAQPAIDAGAPADDATTPHADAALDAQVIADAAFGADARTLDGTGASECGCRSAGDGGAPTLIGALAALAWVLGARRRR